MSAVQDPKMVYNYLGCSGLRVSNICLGAMTFGVNPERDAPGQLNEEQSHALMDKFVELGGNFIDTANVYSAGKSEEIVGSWLKKQQREKIILATKVRGVTGPGCNDLGLSRKHIIDQVEKSLERLQTNYIDLYQTHVWDVGTPIEETLRTLDDLVRCGKVRYVGASNVKGWQLQLIAERCRGMGLNKLITLQQQYSLLSRESELEVFDVCRNEGIGVLPWSPLKGGLLTGKFKRDADIGKDNRIGWAASKGISMQSHPSWEKYNSNEKYWSLIDLMSDISQQYGKSLPQVAIRWLLQKDLVPSVIIGATKMTQLENNIDAANGWELTSEQMSSLDAASMFEKPYPYEMVDRINANRRQLGQQQ